MKHVTWLWNLFWIADAHVITQHQQRPTAAQKEETGVSTSLCFGIWSKSEFSSAMVIMHFCILILIFVFFRPK
jgi:hypothetical protein